MLSVEIEYCVPCGLRGLALELSDRLLGLLEGEITSLRLIPSDGGRFEVTLNGQLVFSKKQSKKRAEIDEIVALIQEMRKTT